MAELTTNHYMQVWANGASDKAALYALRNVTTGDTCDLAADFSVVKQATLLGTTVAGTDTVHRIRHCGRPSRRGCPPTRRYLLVWGASA